MPVRTRIIQVPYDSGHKGFRMGRGPGRIVHSLEIEKGADGQSLASITVENALGLEVGTTFQVVRELAREVRVAADAGEFPLVLAGGCISCVGTIAGLGTPPPVVIWLDAHGDFNTPETTISGFLDGMALATAVGRCWSKLSASVPGFHAVPESQVVLVGAREFDAAERVLLDSSSVHLVASQRIRNQGVRAALDLLFSRLTNHADRAYLHVDLDVLDSAEARVNQFAAPGGLTLSELLEIVRLARHRFPLAAAAITAYDPEYDESDRALRAALAVVQELARQD